MREVAQLLNEMRAEGAITEYALFGAVAQMRYTEPVATLDADVLVVLPSAEGLDVLAPIYRFCARKGYAPEGESVRVGAWPVQFVPVFSPLTQEALEQADTAEFEGVPFRVVCADYLAVIAMLAQRHGLSDAWSRFKTRFLDD
jgi:hypothetical protein